MSKSLWQEIESDKYIHGMLLVTKNPPKNNNKTPPQTPTPKARSKMY